MLETTKKAGANRNLEYYALSLSLLPFSGNKPLMNLADYLASPDVFERLVTDLRVQGWSMQPTFFSAQLNQDLRADALQLDDTDLKQAGIGRLSDHHKDQRRRRDSIRWIDPETPARQQYLDAMLALRIELNKSLILGLWDYEAHFARYDEGDFYEKHLDAFKGKSNRVLTTVLYLNDDWHDEAGGEIVLYDEYDHDMEIGRFAPTFGRMLIFLSEAFPHEVLLAKQTRHSIAGWFRVNNSIMGAIDPDQ